MSFFEMPETLPERQGWMERQIVGVNFIHWIDQLQVISEMRHRHAIVDHNPMSHKLETDGVEPQVLASGELSDRLGTWSRDGLSSMTENEMRAILQRPDQLIDLQFKVFSIGSEYWKHQIEKYAALPSKPFEEMAFNPASARAVEPIENASAELVTPEINSKPSWYRVGLGLLAMAASILFIVLLTNRQRDKTIVDTGNSKSASVELDDTKGWGWQNESMRLSIVDSDEYLEWLSKGAESWFNVKVSSVGQFSQRLDELRDGCQSLIDGEHRALTPDQAIFLVNRCREWQTKLNRQAAELISEPDRFLQIKAKTDQTIRNAIAVLRDMNA